MASRMAVDVEGANKACAERLGFRDMKKEQKEAIMKFVVEGQDVFLCLPTGFCKSLCYYSIPILCDILAERNSPWLLVVIVSPLIALMNDQVASLMGKGLNAVSIVVDSEGSDIDSEGSDDYQSAVVRGNFQYIFMTPEILLKSKSWINVFQSPSFNERLVGIIIDEAHCVKNWSVLFMILYCYVLS